MQISGKVYNIIYNNDDNNFKILNLDNSGVLETIKGIFPMVEVGDNIKCEGEYIEHQKFGLQFDAKSFTKIFPEKIRDIKNYLSSGVIKGIGEVLSERIIEMFGEDSLDIIYKTPEKLEKVKGISKEKAIEIGEEFRNKREIFNLVEFLKEYNLSMEDINKIYEIFKIDSIEVIKENPYILIDILYNINFKDIDRIALKQGIEPTSENRIIAIIKYIMKINLNNGHTFIEKQELLNFLLKNIDLGYEYLEDILYKLEMSDYLVIDENIVTLKSIDYAEENIVEKILEIKENEIDIIPNFNKLLEKQENKSEIELSNEQKNAIKSVNGNNISIITGGPGTGKTTILKIIIDIFKENGRKVEIAAPTGKAAKRIIEATGHEAQTIHRLLNIGKIDEDKNRAVYFDIEKLETDLLIIDEASMLDIYLFHYILKALKPYTKLVIIGDFNQLPSIGPGKVLSDLIDSNIIHTIYLKEIFRQAKTSNIVINAHRVNNGKYIEIDNINNKYSEINSKNIKCKNKESSIKSDLKIIDVADINIMFNELIRILNKENLNKFFKDSIILSPTKKGKCGTINLNKEIQEIFNRNKGKVYGKIEFKKNDRVMQIKNNYDLVWEQQGKNGVGVFNGDTGKIIRIDEKNKKIIVKFDDEKEVQYNYSELDQLMHSYAITVHKSQGSEFEKVILILPHVVTNLLTRNILYTAMSRAKSELIIIGSNNILKRMVNTVKINSRRTRLKIKLIKEYEFREKKKKRKK